MTTDDNNETRAGMLSPSGPINTNETSLDWLQKDLGKGANNEGSLMLLGDKNYWALLLLLLCVVVVFGNVLVILSVARERLLQNLTNFFIVSLAVADLLVAGFVMPFSVYVLVNWGMWGLPKMVCDFYIALDVVCSTSSIFNLVAISIDRYYAVTAPIQYSQHRDNHSRAYGVIAVCWLASIAIGSPIMLGANPIPIADNSSISANNTTTSPSEESEAEFVCAFYNPDFIIYSSLGSFFIPCIVMIYLYARIFKALHQRAVIARMAKEKKQFPKASLPSGSAPQPSPAPGPPGPAQATIVTAQGNSCMAETRLMTGDGPDRPRAAVNGKAMAIDGVRKTSAQSGTVMIDIRIQEMPEDHDQNGQQQAGTADNGCDTSSPPTDKTRPQTANKACGPDTSFYQRSRSVSQQATSSTAPPIENKAQNGSESGRRRSSLSPPDDVSPLPTPSPRPGRGGSSGDAEVVSGGSNNNERGVAAPGGGGGPGAGGMAATSTHAMNTFAFDLSKRSRRKKKKEKNSAKKEKKATQTLAIVLACFLVCWVPFFTCNVTNAIYIKFDLAGGPGDTAFNLTTWLGYMNSCINPLIYTIFNPEFRKAFKRILGMGH